MDNNEIKNRLKSINWNFDFSIDYKDDALHPFNCRKYYSYPATFIPEIPYALIEILSDKGDIVLDPFGGIGTTFLQSLTLERIPFTFDVNPVASTVCDTLYLLFNPTINKYLIRDQLLRLCEGYDCEVDYSESLSTKRKELSTWYEKSTFNEMAFLFLKYDNIQDVCEKKVMKLVLSSILVTLSSQNKGWAYIADNVKPKSDELRKKHVFDLYKLSLKTLFTDVSRHEAKLPVSFAQFYNNISRTQHVFSDTIINSEMPSKSVDLIITSPPYPKMIDYVKSQRLSFNFLDENYMDFVNKEIGARCRRSRNDTLRTYEESIKQINKKMVDLLKSNGFLCIVLPDYDSGDSRKATIENLIADYYSLGLSRVFEVSRYIPSHKRTLSIQWATLVNERIYIFQKE